MEGGERVEKGDQMKNKNGKVGQFAMGKEKLGSTKTLEDWCKRKRDVEEGIGEDMEERSQGRTSKRMLVAREEEGEGEMRGRECVILREIRELREEGRRDREELKGGIEDIRKEIEEVKREMRWKEEIWRKEREELKERVGRLERSIEERQESEGGEKMRRLEVRIERLEREDRGKVNKGEGVEGRMRRMERLIEKEEREKRRRNVIFKGVRAEGGKVKEEIIKLCREMKVSEGMEFEEIKRVRTGREDKGEMIIIKVKKEEDKRKILENKGRLRGREVWVEEDLTFKERKMNWNLRRIREEEIRRGKMVKIGYGKICIENVWWYWDEEEEELKDGRGRRRDERVAEGERQGEERRGH